MFGLYLGSAQLKMHQVAAAATLIISINLAVASEWVEFSKFLSLTSCSDTIQSL